MSPRAGQHGSPPPAPIGTFPLSWNGDILTKSRQFPTLDFECWALDWKLMLTLSGIRKAYGERVLFADATLQVNRQDRIGLVGPNGAGKTTLFTIILGEESADEGKISCERGIRSATCRRRTCLSAMRRWSNWPPPSRRNTPSCGASSRPGRPTIPSRRRIPRKSMTTCMTGSTSWAAIGSKPKPSKSLPA